MAIQNDALVNCRAWVLPCYGHKDCFNDTGNFDVLYNIQLKIMHSCQKLSMVAAAVWRAIVPGEFCGKARETAGLETFPRFDRSGRFMRRSRVSTIGSPLPPSLTSLPTCSLDRWASSLMIFSTMMVRALCRESGM